MNLKPTSRSVYVFFRNNRLLYKFCLCRPYNYDKNSKPFPFSEISTQWTPNLHVHMYIHSSLPPCLAKAPALHLLIVLRQSHDYENWAIGF